MKRTIQVNVKMSEEDFALLKEAADKHWPDAKGRLLVVNYWQVDFIALIFRAKR